MQRGCSLHYLGLSWNGCYFSPSLARSFHLMSRQTYYAKQGVCHLVCIVFIWKWIHSQHLCECYRPIVLYLDVLLVRLIGEEPRKRPARINDSLKLNIVCCADTCNWLWHSHQPVVLWSVIPLWAPLFSNTKTLKCLVSRGVFFRFFRNFEIA